LGSQARRPRDAIEAGHQSHRDSRSLLPSLQIIDVIDDARGFVFG
jgi:hypothetical protein